MELLVFGHAGLPVLVFPTSGGRFFDFEDRGMVAALANKIDAGQLQLFASIPSIARAGTTARSRPAAASPVTCSTRPTFSTRLCRLSARKTPTRDYVALGASFGGYHAVNIALRHPELFSGFFSMSGVFDLTVFLQGYYDQNCYFHLPTHYLPRLEDPRLLARIRANHHVLTTGWDDQCLKQNQEFDRILTDKGNSARVARVGCAEFARLADVAAHGAALSLGTRKPYEELLDAAVRSLSSWRRQKKNAA